MYQKEQIAKILGEYDSLYEKIGEIVDLHSKKDDCYYEINEIELAGDCLVINVEFYKWQDINHHVLTVELDLLTDEKALKEFEESVNKAVQERKQKEQQKLEEQKQKDLEKALKLIKENEEAVKLMKENNIDSFHI